MSSIDTQFEQVRSQGQVAFMPFITAGDSDLEFTADLIRALDQAGCSLIELGFPYSDPIADGPVIQESYTRALKKNVRVNEILEMVEQVSPTIQVPLVAMVSYAIIFRHGIETFLDQCRGAGIAGLIVPDLPSDESDELRDGTRRPFVRGGGPRAATDRRGDRPAAALYFGPADGRAPAYEWRHFGGGSGARRHKGHRAL